MFFLIKQIATEQENNPHNQLRRYYKKKIPATRQGFVLTRV